MKQTVQPMASTGQTPPRVLSAGVVLALALSALFFWIWYERYLSIDFNELGRHYDAETQTVYTDSAIVWCLPAFGLLSFAIVKIVYRLWRRRPRRAFIGDSPKRAP